MSAAELAGGFELTAAADLPAHTDPEDPTRACTGATKPTQARH
jgi:hypothetical protein